MFNCNLAGSAEIGDEITDPVTQNDVPLDTPVVSQDTANVSQETQDTPVVSCDTPVVSKPKKPKKAKKAKKVTTKKKVKKVKKSDKRGRGRPPVFVGEQKEEILRLLALLGATGARKCLAANSKTKLAQLRNLEVIPKPLHITAPTLGKFAKEAGIKLALGRPKKAA